MRVPATPSTFRASRRRMWAQYLGMRTFTRLPPVPSDHQVDLTDQLWQAVAAYVQIASSVNSMSGCAPPGTDK
jgi:hypothetical protein